MIVNHTSYLRIWIWVTHTNLLAIFSHIAIFHSILTCFPLYASRFNDKLIRLRLKPNADKRVLYDKPSFQSYVHDVSHFCCNLTCSSQSCYLIRLKNVRLLLLDSNNRQRGRQYWKVLQKHFVQLKIMCLRNSECRIFSTSSLFYHLPVESIKQYAKITHNKLRFHSPSFETPTNLKSYEDFVAYHREMFYLTLSLFLYWLYLVLFLFAYLLAHLSILWVFAQDIILPKKHLARKHCFNLRVQKYAHEKINSHKYITWSIVLMTWMYLFICESLL